MSLLRKIIYFAVFIAYLPALTGCGFQPVYGQQSTERVFADLNSIKIQPIPDRIGQQLYNFLQDDITPRGEPLEPTYILQVSIKELRKDLGIQKDATATFAKLTVEADYRLKNPESDKVIYKSLARSSNSYNILLSTYATISAEADARERALREISAEIRSDLALFFAAQQPKSAY